MKKFEEAYRSCPKCRDIANWDVSHVGFEQLGSDGILTTHMNWTCRNCGFLYKTHAADYEDDKRRETSS